MTKKTGLWLATLLLAATGLSGCGGSNNLRLPPGGSSGALVLLSQDAPLDDLVKFEITLDRIVANPGAVTVFSVPLELELTDLQLARDVVELVDGVPVGTYNSLTLTFSNPEIKLRDPGTGNIIEVKPPLQPAEVMVNTTFSVAGSQATGLVLDFDLLASILTDAGGNITGVSPTLTASLLNLGGEVKDIEDIKGRVVAVNTSAGSFDLDVFSNCQVLTLFVDQLTTFEGFPNDPASLADMQTDQVVEVEIDVDTDGTLFANVVDLEDDIAEDEVEGLIVDLTLDGTGAVVGFDLVPLDVISCTAASLTTQTLAVSLPADPTAVDFRIDDDGLPVNTALFDSRSDLVVGQKVEIDPVEPLTAGITAVTAEKVTLKDGTLRGTVDTISVTTFTLIPTSGIFGGASLSVETSFETEFDDLPNGVGSLTQGQAVRVRGLLFKTLSGGLVVVAKKVDGTP